MVRPTTVEGWSRLTARQVRKGQNKQVLESVKALRQLGQPSADTEVSEAIALARLGRMADSRAIGDRLVRRGRDASQVDAWRAVERLVAWYTLSHSKPEQAWQLLAPLRGPRCVDRRSCDLHARLLVHWPGLTPAQLRTRLSQAQPKGDATATAAWQGRIIRALVDRRRWPAVDAVVADSLQRWPAAPETWAAWMYAARRRRGPQHRTAWAKALEKASLSESQLRAIGTTPEVEADALLVVGLWRLLLRKPGVTPTDRLTYIQLLTRNHRRGVSSTSRDELKRLSSSFSGQPATRLALVEGLLVSGAFAAAADLLRGMPRTPRVIAFEAELAREKGAIDEARRLAKQAVRAAAASLKAAPSTAAPSTAGAAGRPVAAVADGEAAIALLLATLWRTHLPKDAANWRTAAAKAGGDASVETTGGRALVMLAASRPPSSARRVLVAYAAALNRALLGDLHARSDAERRRGALLKNLVRKGRYWRSASRACLTELARAPTADAGTFVALARLNYADSQPRAGLGAWRMAEKRARATGETLDRTGFLGSLVRGTPPGELARWLRFTGLQRVDDTWLSWRVARRLLYGRHKLLGRRWVAAALARSVGTDVALDRLPPLKRVRRSTTRRHTPLSDSDLRRLASSGAADLLLDYLPELRQQGPAMSTPGKHVKYGVAEASALAQMGQAARAGHKLRELAALGGLRPVDRRNLLNVAWQHGLCDVTLDLAQRFVAQRDTRTFKLAVRQGVTCAQRMGDTPAAFKIAVAAERKQISLSHQLTMIRELADHGFDRMAIHFFEGKFRMSRARTSQSSYIAWATALLANGRPESALVRLKRGIKITRRRPQVWRKGAQVLEEYGQIQLAVQLLRDGLELHGKDLSMHLSLVRNLLRLGDMEAFRHAMRGFVRAGPSRVHWQSLLTTALSQGRVAELHVVLTELLDHDREVDRVRVRVAAFLGDRRALLAALRRLRAKGPVVDRDVLAALRHVGAEREARAVAQDLVTEQGPARPGRGRKSPSDALNMRAALQVRHDPSSRKEALAFARLRVGRSLHTGNAALASSAALADEGYLREARALGALALSEVGYDEALLCRQGKIAFAGGHRKEALALWRRAVAATLTQASGTRRSRSRYRRSTAVPTAITCLVWAADAAGEHVVLRRWLRQWRDALPRVSQLWRWTIVESINAGRLAEATTTLRRAEERLSSWKASSFKGVAQSILRHGGGPQLLAGFLARRPRPEAWWLAFAAKVAVAHGKAGDPAVASLQRDISALALNTHEGRSWLALEYFARGDTKRGLAMLGQAPLARVPRARSDAQWRHNLKRASGMMSAKAGAALLGKSVPAQDDIGARAAARGLIAVIRGPHGNGQPAITTVEVPATAINTALPTARRWLRTAGLQGSIRLAHALTLQGHATVGRAVLKLVPLGKDARLPRWLQERRVRVFAAAGTHAEVVAAARIALDGTRPRSYYQPLGRAMAFGRMASQLVAWGRPAAAAKLVASAPVWARGDAPVGLDVAASLERPAQVIRAIRSYDRSGLAWLRAAQPGTLPSADGAVAVGLALAAGDTALAERWATATAAHHDSPWRVWLLAARHALDHAELEMARRFVATAARAQGPAGALACVHAQLGDGKAVAPCRDGRPLAGLANWQLVAFAAGVCQSATPEYRQALTKEVALSGDSDRMRWIAALAAAQHHIPPGAKPQAAALARGLLDAIADEKARRQLINVALDNLAALGLGTLGIGPAQHNFKRSPNAHSARNNLGYARLLAGQPAKDVLAFVGPEFVVHRGEPAHALLDTMATALAKSNQPKAARRALRWSLSASKNNSDTSQLPLVRYATFLADAGRLADARVVALGALRRAADLPAITGRHGDGSRSSVYARQISIRVKGLAVLRRYLRAAPPAAAPSAPAVAPAVAPAATPPVAPVNGATESISPAKVPASDTSGANTAQPGPSSALRL